MAWFGGRRLLKSGDIFGSVGGWVWFGGRLLMSGEDMLGSYLSVTSKSLNEPNSSFSSRTCYSSIKTTS